MKIAIGLLLCLMVINEITALRYRYGFPRPKPRRTCRTTYVGLEALQAKYQQKECRDPERNDTIWRNDTRPKREFMSPWSPYQCIHVAVVQNAVGTWMFHVPIHDCCSRCLTEHRRCGRVHPWIICGSLAHTCSCNCRSQWLESGERGKRGSCKPSKMYGICKKRTCSRPVWSSFRRRYLRGRCCYENLCFPLFAPGLQCE